MKKFKDIPYARPDIEAESAAFRSLLADFSGARSAEAAREAMDRLSALRDRISTVKDLAEIRHTCDTTDPFYEAENDFWDGASPRIDALEHELYAALVSSPFRKELEAVWGPHIFRMAECRLAAFKPGIEELLAAENRLSSEYDKLKASASIPFDGRVLNLAELGPYMESPDRETRGRAVSAVSGFYRDHGDEFDRIYAELVAVRHRIALELGFPNFVPLAYARLGRTDYGPAEVASYRSQVLRTVVPLAASLRERQARRLGLPVLAYRDEAFEFPTGNPRPVGGTPVLLEAAGKMYDEMSAETGSFFRMMRERELFDLETRKGKALGGYCSYLPAEGVPFVFANNNGTSDDIDTLTHEVGHAFQVSRGGRFAFPEYHWPTLEACEIHSMSMEFLAWPWMEGFFGADADKYLFRHLTAGILFLPYGVLVDEFQHWVYEHPGAAPAERRAAWRRMERVYLPWRDYEGDGFLEAGGYWFRQGHIFQDPFYYIDYTLAQVCAYEFWALSRSDRPGAWRRYLALCDAAGSRPFLDLLGVASLRNPFAEGSIAGILAPARTWMDAVDDRGF
ncbi:MAG TPA: M3 family oligoendopeptidase [Spirochaetia bacterium]|nr:M3 family oligoendopeptidase [Spirochaetales bacterium]HRY80472.1 M3 family oligoendopeptidase [Spirochaetia bacterium]